MFIPRMWVHYGDGEKFKFPKPYADIQIFSKADIRTPTYRRFLRIETAGPGILINLYSPEYEFTHYGIKVYGTEQLTHIPGRGFMDTVQEIDLITNMETWIACYGKDADKKYGLTKKGKKTS